MEADQDGDGKLSFEEFSQTVANTVRMKTINTHHFYNLLNWLFPGHRQADDT